MSIVVGVGLVVGAGAAVGAGALMSCVGVGKLGVGRLTAVSVGVDVGILVVDGSAGCDNWPATCLTDPAVSNMIKQIIKAAGVNNV